MSKEGAGYEPAVVTRVICASVSRVQGSVMGHLFAIRDRNCGKGPATPVKGAVLYSSGWFVLWLEGSAGEVERVLRRAAGDPGNALQQVIHRSTGAATLTETFTVVTTQGADDIAAFGRRVHHFKALHALGSAVEPAHVWQRLSAPCPATREPDAAPDYRIALVSAGDNGPIDLLRRLGERFGSTVAYQRFARGEVHSGDVGVAYVDVVSQWQARRIQLVSRRALGQRMVQRSLDPSDALVLLLTGSPGAAIDLATSVCACLQAQDQMPAIYLVTDFDEVASAVARVLGEGITNDQPLELAHVGEAQLADLFMGTLEAPAAQGTPGRAAARGISV